MPQKDPKEIKFSYNWNNKLSCKCFTTMRLSSRFLVGDTVRIYLKDKYYAKGIIRTKSSFKMQRMTEAMAYIDTGYSLEECKTILKKMYRSSEIQWNIQDIYLYVIEKVESDLTLDL